MSRATPAPALTLTPDALWASAAGRLAAPPANLPVATQRPSPVKPSRPASMFETRTEANMPPPVSIIIRICRPYGPATALTLSSGLRSTIST